MITKKDFCKKGDLLITTQPNCCHSHYMGKLLRLLGLTLDYELESFCENNRILEQITAQKLNVNQYYDGASIVLIYAEVKTEQELASESDIQYQQKYNTTFEQHTRQGWHIMFETMFDVFTNKIGGMNHATLS